MFCMWYLSHDSKLYYSDMHIQSILDISKLWGLFFTKVQITRSAHFILRVIETCKKSIQCKIIVGESNQNVFLTHIDASKFAEFEKSELELSSVDLDNFILIVIV